jgi:hypothetical protein
MRGGLWIAPKAKEQSCRARRLAYLQPGTSRRQVDHSEPGGRAASVCRTQPPFGDHVQTTNAGVTPRASSRERPAESMRAGHRRVGLKSVLLPSGWRSNEVSTRRRLAADVARNRIDDQTAWPGWSARCAREQVVDLLATLAVRLQPQESGRRSM